MLGLQSLPKSPNAALKVQGFGSRIAELNTTCSGRIRMKNPSEVEDKNRNSRRALGSGSGLC